MPRRRCRDCCASSCVRLREVDDRPPVKRTAATGLLYTDGATGHLRVRRYRLQVLSGPSAGACAEIEGGTLLVGTHANNDLRLAGQTVSRYHPELQARA